jgi:alkanesulfonate monooxygenase SsuD/methylene tetrahydromethanopterin reductase-like flavin-dependent oxidoreductase (luciferase family)
VRYGIVLTAGDPRTAASMAAEAEAAGWDGVFTWDGIAIGDAESWDPWVLMAAMATATERVTLGAIVTPPSRRRPWKLAREALTLDHLSGGRLVLPVGLGALDDGAFGNVGEPTDVRTRAELLDETLAILDGLWTGEPFRFEGAHYRFSPMTFRPRPVQRPRIPIWVVAAWPSERSMTRAARWDGVLPQALASGGVAPELTPADLERAVAWIEAHRAPDVPGVGEEPYDVVAQGGTPADDAEAARNEVRRWRDAGATWWIEADWAAPAVDPVRRRIAAGPPRG